MTKSIKELFKDTPKDKVKEILNKLLLSTDVDDLIAKAKECDVVLDVELAEKLFDKLKNITELSDKDLAFVAGGHYLA